jgi:hypothetical protein
MLRGMDWVIKNRGILLLIYGRRLSGMHVKGFVLFELGVMNVVACLCCQDWYVILKMVIFLIHIRVKLLE